MKTEFTKGEWKYVNNDLTEYIIKTDEMDICTARCIDIDDEEAEANAKLISAAPELLASLRQLIDACLENVNTKEISIELFEAEQAFKKATE